MKDLLPLLFVGAVLFLPSTITQQSNRTIDEKESEGYVAFIVNSESGEDSVQPDKPDDGNACACNGTKQLTHGDGHKTPCPCDNCKCKKITSDPQPISLQQKYYLVKFTAEWCAPCKSWDQVEKPKLESAGFKVESYDIDEEPDLAEKYNFDTIPYFLLVDTQSNKIVKRFGNETAETIYSEILKLNQGN
jgi:thioredoxin 1